jgi:hypothetical protein
LLCFFFIKQEEVYDKNDTYRPSSERDSTKNNAKSLTNSETNSTLPSSSTFGSLNEDERKRKIAENVSEIADYQK